VVVPDFFNGEPYSENASRPFHPWLKDHDLGKGIETAKLVIVTLKRRGVYVVRFGGLCKGDTICCWFCCIIVFSYLFIF